MGVCPSMFSLTSKRRQSEVDQLAVVGGPHGVFLQSLNGLGSRGMEPRR